MLSGAGKNNLSDIGTDLCFAAGNLKDTNRYSEADATFKKAKSKYGVDSAKIVGQSLFGAIAGYIGNPDKDQIITLDKGATIGQKVRKGENSYRSKGDVVFY